jgi:hypothetical protein
MAVVKGKMSHRGVLSGILTWIRKDHMFCDEAPIERTENPSRGRLATGGRGGCAALAVLDAVLQAG